MNGTISFDFSNMCASHVGMRAIADEQIALAAQKIGEVHAAMCKKKDAMAWRGLPYNQDEVVEKIEKAAKEIRAKFENFVVLGIGGSALGSKALFSACCHPFYNELPAEKRGGPRFYVLDNVDPDLLTGLLDTIDPEKTAFHVITKSGNTVETMTQFMLVSSILSERLGGKFKENLYITTDKEKGILKTIVNANGWDNFIVTDGVGGRFSVLCPVGLLSAAVLGLDIRALLAGAAAMDKECTKPTLEENPAYLYALLYTEAMKMGANISVVMPYANALAPTAEWYCQLWAESLGKRTDNAGNIVNAGQTPVRALGVTDQHSQIQLYNEGPFDKIITFIEVENFKNQLSIPKAPFSVGESEYLAGQSFNKLISSEMAATVRAVSDAGKMNNTIKISELNEYTFGKLLFFFEMATAAAGEFLSINAFDQPGVEAGKIATFALMGRAGYEDEAKRLSQTAKPRAELTFRV